MTSEQEEEKLWLMSLFSEWDQEKEQDQEMDQDQEKSWSMYPELHEKVSTLLQESDLICDFHKEDTDDEAMRKFDTNIEGKFECSNKKCKNKRPHKWMSQRTSITIRMYRDKSYNARVYHQGCKFCKSIVRPSLLHSYAERVAYQVKKWRHIDSEKPPPPLACSQVGGGDHDNGLCEGCKVGHCRFFKEEKDYTWGRFNEWEF